jgi:hypothetical protein
MGGEEDGGWSAEREGKGREVVAPVTSGAKPGGAWKGTGGRPAMDGSTSFLVSRGENMSDTM